MKKFQAGLELENKILKFEHLNTDGSGTALEINLWGENLHAGQLNWGLYKYGRRYSAWMRVSLNLTIFITLKI